MSAWLRNLNISSRLMVIIIGINVITLFLICLVAISSNQQALEQQARDRFVEKNQQTVQSIGVELEWVITTANQLQSAFGTLSTYSQAEMRAVVRDIITQDNDLLIQRISVYRPETEESDDSVVVFEEFQPSFGFVNAIRIFSTDSQQPPQNAPMFAASTENRPIWFMQESAYASDEGIGAISLALPYNFQSDRTGVIWVDIPKPLFDEMLTEQVNRVALLSDSTDEFIALVDQNGQIVSQVGTRSADITADIMQEIMSRAEATATSAEDLSEIDDPLTGNRELVSLTEIELTNWQLVSLFSREDIPVSSGILALQLITLSVVGIVLMILAINYFTTRAIVEPLMNLSRAAQEIGSGDLRYHIGYRGADDEIGFLARAMEGMKGNIAHSYEELRTWSRTLEARVYERTKELNATRRQAEQTASDLQAVYDESLMVVNEPTLEPILEALVHRILNLLDASYCSVWLLDDDRQTVRLINNTQEADVEPFMMTINEGMVGEAIRSGLTVTIDDYRQYDKRVSLPYQNRDPYVRAMVAPMLFDAKPMGALVVGRDENGKPFNESDTRLLSLFSNLVSPVIRNAQLFNQREAARREAERANQVKTRFLASVTHELRTPLNLVINNMDFMRIGAFGDVTNEQVSRLNQTVRSAEHLLYLINDLLDVSKIEAGEMQLFIQPNDVYTLIEDSIDTTHAFIEKIDGKADAVELVVNIEENLPKIPMDARRIRQVLINLLSNAVKFTHAGTVTLQVKSVEAGIYFAVIDTGIGVPEDEKNLLFEAFERTTQAKEQAIEGTGLGLPISQFLIQQHGGVIDVDSVAGEGTTFMFTLPFVTPEVTQTNTDSPVILPATQVK